MSDRFALLQTSLEIPDVEKLKRAFRSGKEKRCARLVLEIILGRAMLRYTVMAEEFNFKYLGQRATDSVLAKFALLVQDLARCAPHAFLNRGAFELRDHGGLSGDYPSRNAFHEEIIWLLWQIAKAESPPAGIGD